MKRTVLVVDDSPTVVKFVTLSLRKGGYEVVAASDGMEAIEKVSGMTGDVDLVITDLDMPNLDGYGLITTLRENERFTRTPIIILSSSEGDDDRTRGLEVGASSYLVKPFNAELLLDEVGKYLN